LIKFTIAETPVPQGRPRLSSRGNFAHAYDPPKSKEYKDKCKGYANGLVDELLTEALRVTLEFHMPIPKSKPKKFREAALKGVVKHTKKPDCDNLAKSILDSLTDILWVDDSQIIELNCKKFYGEPPRTEVKIEEVV
jgi:Holliday junction resolvase RusA-like endonuclease